MARFALEGKGWILLTKHIGKEMLLIIPTTRASRSSPGSNSIPKLCTCVTNDGYTSSQIVAWSHLNLFTSSLTNTGWNRKTQCFFPKTTVLFPLQQTTQSSSQLLFLQSNMNFLQSVKNLTPQWRRCSKGSLNSQSFRTVQLSRCKDRSKETYLHFLHR